MTPAELDMLWRALPRGREHATSIPDLCARLSMHDRQVREGIQRLVDGELEGRRIPVVTLPCRDGVFVATTPEELDLGDAHLRSKAQALLRRRRSLRLCREGLAWSPTLFDQ